MIKESQPLERAQLVQRFADQQRFPLDPFQIEAMTILTEGDSVLVSAPTGSGKTIVAEYAIFLARATNTRCIYTTPLKALSNQKYRDLHADMGDDVGLVTGDVVINPTAPVLIMTTEILRNILQADPEQLSDVSQVILDEAHYIGSDGRGTVWEETIVFLGKHTSIVALSATIPNADELATWVSSVHKPMRVVYHDQRPVPLEPFIFMEKAQPLFDKRGKLRFRGFQKDGKEGWIDEPLSSQVVRDLHKQKLLPAIFFVFSRMGCEREALEVIRQGIPLTTPEEQAQIDAAVAEAIAKTPGMLTSHATKGWLERLRSGVAPHHAGLLPPLKLLIEVLFQRNLLKAVFATETLAAGINMPARTVVITSLSKRTDEGHRMLTVSEFAQMTGRAGRRGMDTVGYGVVYPSHRYSVHDVAALFKGQPEPLRSRFTLNYNMVVNLIHRYPAEQARRIVEQCFSQFQNNQTVLGLHTLKQQAQQKLEKLDPRCPKFPEEHERAPLLEAYSGLKQKKEEARKKLANVEASRSFYNKQEGARAVKAAPFDSWIVVQTAEDPEPQLAILLDKFPVKSGDVQYTVLMSGGRLTRLSVRNLIQVLNVPVKGVPKALNQRASTISYQQVSRVKDMPIPWEGWLEASQIDPQDILPHLQDPPDLAKAKAGYAEAIAAMQESHCHNCKFFGRCKDDYKEHVRYAKDAAFYQEQIDAIRGKYWREYQQLQAVLETGGFTRGRELLPRGVAMANLRTSNELMAAEALASGVFEDLSPSELCAAASMIVAEPIRGRMAWHPIKPSPKAVQVSDTLFDMARELYNLQIRCKVENDQPYLTPEYAGMVQAWADQAQWNHVVEIAGIDEGQLVRHLRQVIDMLQQFKDVPGTTTIFQDKVRSAIALIDRDIVQEVF
ncbi:MAG TPA: DEAD/DEAH box helicase [Oscillatoriaceae cyanobacterium]